MGATSTTAGLPTADAVIFNETFQTRFNEVLQQNANAFNGASGGALQLTGRDIMGWYEQQDQTDLIPNLVKERDPDSLSVTTDDKLQQTQKSGVKVFRRSQVANAHSYFRLKGQDPGELAIKVAEQLAVAQILDYLNTLITAIDAAIPNLAATAGTDDREVDHTGNTFKPEYINDARALMGDQGEGFNVVITHSKPWYDNRANQIADKHFQLTSNMIVFGGSPGYLGSIVIVTDSAALVDTVPIPDVYKTLVLRAGAAEAVVTNAIELLIERLSGQENLVTRFQGEWDWLLSFMGYSWNEGAGGTKPANTALGTPANWTQTATDIKNTMGVRILTD